MIVLVFAIFIALSAFTAIFFRLRSNLLAYGFFKAFTTILIIVLSVLLNQESQSNYGWTITLGLVLSLIGDILLLKKSLFVFGLGAFLLAHILFIYAFSTLLGFQSNIFVISTLLLVGGAYYGFLYPSLKSMALPVAFYILAIIVMDWQAISLMLHTNHEMYHLIGIGAILFSFSDGVIAYQKFKHHFKFSEVLVLSTYWIAIFLFCWSISPTS